MMNKLDPRVDSDNSKAYDNNSSRSTGTSTGGYGTSGNNSLGATGQSGLGGSSTDYGSSTTSSEPVHKSNMMNKIDPRVDSDNSKAYGNTSSGLASNTNSSTGFGSSSGPHQTGTANALDPNVNASYGNTSSSGLGSSTAYDSTNSGASTTGAGFGGNSALPDSHGVSLEHRTKSKTKQESNVKAVFRHQGQHRHHFRRLGFFLCIRFNELRPPLV